MHDCPYCECGDHCGRESIRIPDHSRAERVFEAVRDLDSKHRWVRDIDPLYLSQELVMRGYFGHYDPPSISDVGSAQDIIRNADK